MRDPSMNEDEQANTADRRLRIRYAALTLLLALPLLLAFVFVRNLYPFAASTMMMAGGDLQTGRDYFILRGERATGEIISLPPVELMNALSGRMWGLVAATVENKSLSIRSPHPSNIVFLLARSGGAENLPPASRLPELLRAWGAIYNARYPSSSPQRLRAVTLEEYRWEPGGYSNYEHFINSWRVEL